MKQSSLFRFILLVVISTSLLNQLKAQQENALNFDGIDDYAAAASASAYIVGGTGITISCWVYPVNSNSTFPNFDGMCGFRNEASADFYLIQLGSNTIEARFRNSSGTEFSITDTSLKLNRWQHYVLTFDGSSLVLYQNGSPDKTIAAGGSISSSSETFYIGKLIHFSDNFQFTGDIDEVALWNKALSPAEVASLYSCGVTGVSGNPELHYSFNQGIAGGNNVGINTLTDNASNLDATLYNFTLNGTTSNFVTGITTGGIINNLTSDICQGDTFWFAGLPLTSPGLYYDTIPITGSCDSIAILNLGVNPLPPAYTINGPVSVIQNQTETYTVPDNSGVSYYWSVINGTIINQVNDRNAEIEWGSPGTGNIKVLASTVDSCLSDTVSLIVTIGTVGLEEINNEVTIYPNPAKKVLFINTEDNTSGIEIRMYNLVGKVVLHETACTNPINVSALRPGLYFIEVVTNGSVIRDKLLIE